MKNLYSTIATIALIVGLLFETSAQDPVTTTGTVIDATTSEALVGVTIQLKGTTIGTITDVNGKYTISAPSNGTLIFSFIGYKTQEVAIGNRTTIDLELQADVEALSEVVVVGYGTQRKTDVTGSTANVKGEELAKQPVLTATQAMQGKVAGVQVISSGQPGSSPQIRIRGVGTAFAGTAALYVVDGVLTDNISNINTADITDMNILKDASATAIYGSRGANGVVIITTKKGEKGKPRVSYNSNVGVRQAANLVEMANAQEYANYVQAATGTIPPTSSYDTDWYNTILRNAFYHNHNISLSGGTDKSTYFLNVGYFDDQGIVLDNYFKRLTARVNEEYSITKKIKIGIQSSFSHSINQNSFSNIDIDPNGKIGNVYNDAYRAAPIIPSRVEGRYGNTSAYQNVGNPLLDLKNNDVKVRENRLQGSGFLEFKPVTWISFRSSFGVDLINSLNRLYNYQFNADETTFITSGGNQYSALSSLNVKETETYRWVWDNIVTFSRTFGKHEVTFLVGATAEKYNRHWFSALRKDVPADPTLWYINVGDANTSQNDGGGDAWARNSYLARLNYAFDGKYLLTGTIRADGSSIVGSNFLHLDWAGFYPGKTSCKGSKYLIC
jgi:TonB-linked SusC/RagA family outer membrane protein